MENTRRRMFEEIIAPGLVGGWTAGLAVLLVALIHSALAGLGFTWPLQMFATSVLDERVLAWPTTAAIVGLVVHIVASGAWGVLFNALVPRGVPYGWAAMAGLLYGGFVFVVMTWLVLPWLVRGLYLTVHPLVLLAYHLLFGAVLPIAIPIRRTVTRTLTFEQTAHTS